MNDSLEGTPHLTIHPGAVMDCVVDEPSGNADGSDSSDCGGRVLLISSAKVETDDVDICLAVIEEVLVDMSSFSAGNDKSGTALTAVSVHTVPAAHQVPGFLIR